MLRNLFLTSIIVVSATNAIFFGGGGSGGGCCCQQSCGCAPPSPPSCSCPAPQPCGGYAGGSSGYASGGNGYAGGGYPGGGYAGGGGGYASPPAQSYAFQPQPGYSQPQQSYSQPQGGYAQTSQSYAQQPQSQGPPRYIIVRPVDSVSSPNVPAVAPSSNYQVNSPAPEPIPQAPAAPVGDSGSYKAGIGAPYNSARASKTVLIDARCNSAELRQVLDENIVSDDANESKRRVYKAANEQFAAADDSTQGIDVICAPGAFSYRIATDFFCEHSKTNITCFAYQQHAAQ